MPTPSLSARAAAAGAMFLLTVGTPATTAHAAGLPTFCSGWTFVNAGVSAKVCLEIDDTNRTTHSYVLFWNNNNASYVGSQVLVTDEHDDFSPVGECKPQNVGVGPSRCGTFSGPYLYRQMRACTMATADRVSRFVCTALQDVPAGSRNGAPFGTGAPQPAGEMPFTPTTPGPVEHALSKPA
jgi:hypothetical protein